MVSKKKSVLRGLRIPEGLYKKIQALVEETGLNEHATMLQLLEEGLKARVLGDTRQQAEHLASKLDAFLKGK